MKTANLVIAIIYTVILGFMFLYAVSVSETDLALGCVMFSPMVVMNWLSFANWKE